MWKSGKRKRTSKVSRVLIVIFLSLITVFIILFFLKLFQLLKTNKNLFISPIPVGQKINKSGFKKIEELLSKNNISFSSITLATDSSFLVKLTNDEEAILASDKPIENQISSLQLVLSRLTIEGKRFIRLDFRFDKPIITFK